MNYIKHLNAFLNRATKDTWVMAYHYTLYMTLFHWWNKTGFKKGISIKRADLMKAAKIRSKTMYYRCLKDLAEAQLLKYSPANSRFTTAEIELIPLDNGPVQVPEEGLYNQTNKKLVKSVSNGPSLDEVLTLFVARQCNTEEGLKFWYQNEATNWMIGLNPIVNWQALAQKWILHIKHRNLTNHVSNDQDYNQSF